MKILSFALLRRAFTLIELLVVITIIGILMAITIPAIGGGVDKARLAATQKSLVGVVNLIALINTDVEAGDTNLSAYPSTNLNNWYNSLTNYCGTNDLMKLFSAGEVRVTSWSSSGPNTNAYYVYAVDSSSEGDTILMTTRNWRAPISGNGPALVKSSKPFGDKGALVLKKGHAAGAQVISSKQATNDISSIGIATNVLN